MKRKISTILLALLCLTVLPTAAMADVIEQGVPEVDAESYLLIEGSTGEVIFSKDPDAVFDPGQLAQLMTAVLVLEKGNLTDIVTVPKMDISHGRRVMLLQGEKISLENLLQAMIVYSAPDAAVAIADHVGGSVDKFVKMMNDKAAELGMTSTTFTNVTGQTDEKQKTTASDMIKLAAYAASMESYRSRAVLPSIVWQSNGYPDGTTLPNANQLVTMMPEALGLKSGEVEIPAAFDESYNPVAPATTTYNLAAAAQKDGRTLVAVMLGSAVEENMYSGMQRLLNFGFDNTKIVPVVQKDTIMTTVQFAEGKAMRVAASQSFSVILAKDSPAITDFSTRLTNVNLPVAVGDEVGTLVVRVDGAVVKEVPLVSMDDAKKPINWLFLFTCLMTILYIIQMALRVYWMIRKKNKNRQRPANGSGSRTAIQQPPSTLGQRKRLGDPPQKR